MNNQFLELEKEEKKLISQINRFEGQKYELELNIKKLKSAKAYKLWRVFNFFLKKIKEILYKIYKKSNYNLMTDPYTIWVKKNFPNKLELRKQKIICKKIQYKPLISIITPVYNTPPIFLSKYFSSIKNQTYENWEICIVDDGSSNQDTITFLKKMHKEMNGKVQVAFLSKNKGIAFATKKAIKMAKGEFIGLVDCDDELTLNALFEMVRVLNKNRTLDMIYSDEDKIDSNGDYFYPHFKPDWDEDLFLAMMYTCHFSIFRKKMLKNLPILNNKYNGSQDYDLVLRLTEKTDKIYHIPKILYHWRVLEGSTSGSEEAKNYAIKSQYLAVADALKRRRLKAHIYQSFPGSKQIRRIKYNIKKNNKVTIVIPTAGVIPLLANCLNSIRDKTSYKNIDIIIIDNSLDKQVGNFISMYRKKMKIRRVVFSEKPFNYSKMINQAVRFANSEYIIVLNDDIVIKSKDWIHSLLEYSQNKKVGVVGMKLIYPSTDTIQHAGIALGIYGYCGNIFKNYPENDPGYFGLMKVARNLTAVTFACVMIKKSIYKKVGGLDEKNLPISLNDIDFCLKVKKLGYKIIYTPFAEAYHYEAASKKEIKKNSNVNIVDLKTSEKNFFIQKWKKYIEADPYYNINFTRKREDYSLEI